MTTLISAANSDGEYGRCDAKCYNAQGGDCECVCGGRNHGAGLRKAIQNTRELADTMMEEFQAKVDEELEFDCQLTLF